MSQPTHTRVVTLYKNGESYREIAKKVGLTFSAVLYAIKHFFATKSLRNDYCSDRPKKLNLTQSRSRIRNLQKSPLMSAPSLTPDLTLSTGDVVHPQTVKNMLYSASIHG